MGLLGLSESLKSALEKWVLYLKGNKRYSAHTIRAYETDIYNFFAFTQHHCDFVLTLDNLSELKVHDFRGWLAFRRSHNLRVASNARALSVVRSFFRYVERYHRVENTAIKTIQIKKSGKALPRALNADHAMAAVAKIKDVLINEEKWVGLRDYAILLLLYGCGMRIGEVVGLTRGQFSYNKDSLVVRGKGCKERVIPILAKVKEAIDEYIAACPYKMQRDSYLFVGLRGAQLNPDVFRQKIRVLKKSIGLPSYTSPHAFRHSFASQLLDEGVDVRVIQDLLGHSHLHSTERYTKVSKSKIVEDYMRYHPRTKDKDE